MGLDCDIDGEDQERMISYYKFINDPTFVVYDRALHRDADTVGTVMKQMKLEYTW